MRVVLLRHATRSALPLEDSALSDVGLQQAEVLGRDVGVQLPRPTTLYTSPKTRARQTARPICEAAALSPLVDERLDERQRSETGKDFGQRVRDFFGLLETTADPTKCVYLVSHLDWLEAAVMAISTSDRDIESAASWMTAEYRIYQFDDGQWSIERTGRAPA